MRERLLRDEEELASLLDLYGKVRAGKRVPMDETQPLIQRLCLSGIVRAAIGPGVSGGRLVVRNRIYERVFDRKWIADHLPGAELRRQRAAYRRGLARNFFCRRFCLRRLYAIPDVDQHLSGGDGEGSINLVGRGDEDDVGWRGDRRPNRRQQHLQR